MGEVPPAHTRSRTSRRTRAHRAERRLPDVRFGSKCEVAGPQRHVRLSSNFGRVDRTLRQGLRACELKPLCKRSSGPIANTLGTERRLLQEGEYSVPEISAHFRGSLLGDIEGSAVRSGPRLPHLPQMRCPSIRDFNQTSRGSALAKTDRPRAKKSGSPTATLATGSRYATAVEAVARRYNMI